MAKILFLQNLWYEYMGVMWISAVLKKHSHSCDVLISDKYKEIRDKIIKLRPDVIGFSCMSGMFNWAKKISQRIKKEFDVIILIGGPHATYFPAIIEKNKDIDVICRGEGEYAILDLMNAIDGEKDSTKIENLWVRKNRKIYKNELRPLISDLDQLPFPDRTIYFKYKFFRKNPTKNFMTARGCPYNCKFCYNHTLKKIYKGKGTYVRYRSPENIVNEILEIKKKYGIKTVYFYDDTFIMDRKWINELMNMYKERVKLPFIAQIRADFVDEVLIKKFSECGCKKLYFGIETGNEQLRNRLLGKQLKNEHIINAARLMKKYKIKFLTFNMVGLPGETLKNAFETVYLNVKIKTNYPWCSIFTPYPGTELGDYALREGLLNKDFDPDFLPASFHKTSLLNQKNRDALINLHKLFSVAVHFPWTIPIIKKLIKLKPNKLYYLIFGFFYVYDYIREQNLSIARTIILTLRSFNIYMKKG